MENQFRIGGKVIGSGFSPYIIAEAGINHNGDLDTALKMIEAAHSAGADAVKFQTFKASEFCGDPSQLFTYYSKGEKITESMLSMFERMELSSSDWKSIKLHAEEIGITFFSTPQNYSDLSILLELGVQVIKVGSDDLTNLPLISSYASVGLPLILSSGMANISEVHNALEAAGWYSGNEVAVLVCTSQYPTPATDVNIRRVKTLRGAFPGLVVGFSDHSIGDGAAIMATALEAQIFEKHFTLSHEMEGPDHWFSLNPTELNSWVASIRGAHQMLGSGLVLPTEEELKMRVLARRSVVALRDISPNEKLSEDNIGLRRPGSGLPPELLPLLCGKKANKALNRGSIIDWSDLS
jgi:N-acetylneuraminate synthase/N,N'-diacetyllegionaminate synthase